MWHLLWNRTGIVSLNNGRFRFTSLSEPIILIRELVLTSKIESGSISFSKLLHRGTVLSIFGMGRPGVNSNWLGIIIIILCSFEFYRNVLTVFAILLHWLYPKIGFSQSQWIHLTCSIPSKEKGITHDWRSSISWITSTLAEIAR